MEVFRVERHPRETFRVLPAIHVLAIPLVGLRRHARLECVLPETPGSETCLARLVALLRFVALPSEHGVQPEALEVLLVEPLAKDVPATRRHPYGEGSVARKEGAQAEGPQRARRGPQTALVPTWLRSGVLHVYFALSDAMFCLFCFICMF